MLLLSKETPQKRCAIYTRKSSERGLRQDFNSLKAQHAICSAYIQSQQHKGWIEIDNVYGERRNPVPPSIAPQ